MKSVASPGAQVLLSVLGWVLVLAGVTAASPTDPEVLLDRAAAAFAERRLDEAQDLVGDAAAALGRVAAFAGLVRRLAGEELVQEALTIATSSASGWIEEGAYADAVTLLREALSRAPASARVHALLGEALSLDQSHRKAAEHLRRAMALGDADLKTLFYLASAEWENGRTEEAERLYRQAVERTGGDFPWLHHLGRLLSWQGRYAEAAEILGRALVARPEAADAQLDFARALEAGGRLEDAAAAYRRAVELAPGLSYSHYGLAQVLARVGDREEARRELSTYRRLHEEEREATRRETVGQARLDRGWELLGSGRADAAVEHFRDLPETAGALEGLAAALAARGEHPAAAAALERAVLLAPERADLRLRLSRERLASQESSE